MRGKNRRPRLMVNFEEVFKKRSKTVTCICELLVDRACRETSGTQTRPRGSFNPGVVRILAELRAADHCLGAGLTSDGLVRKSEDEDARSRTRAPAPLVAQQAMDLELAHKQNTSCEILGGRPLIGEPGRLARAGGLSCVGRARRTRLKFPSISYRASNAEFVHRSGQPRCNYVVQPKSRCGRDEGGEIAVSWDHRAMIARGDR
jgi:hypothetical protein